MAPDWDNKIQLIFDTESNQGRTKQIQEHRERGRQWTVNYTGTQCFKTTIYIRWLKNLVTFIEI